MDRHSAIKALHCLIVLANRRHQVTFVVEACADYGHISGVEVRDKTKNLLSISWGGSRRCRMRRLDSSMARQSSRKFFSRKQTLAVLQRSAYGRDSLFP